MSGRDEIVTTVELAEQLEVTTQRVAAWIKQGMPVHSRNGVARFVTRDVERWLLAKGLIEERGKNQSGTVCRTRAEAAKALGVHQQTLSDWAAGYPNFPGRPGTPGKRDGYFPVDEIQAWRRSLDGPQRAHGGGSLEAERAKLLSIQCQERELRLRQRRGELALKREVLDFLRRTVHQAGSLLNELPDRVMARLPTDIGKDSRDAIRSDVGSVVLDMRAILSELVEGDADEVATE